MGLEDREWYREELRRRGQKSSWDNFSAKDKVPPRQPVQPKPSPAKPRTPPSYVHLQAQEILDARRENAGPPFRLAIYFSVAAALLVIGIFQLLP